MRELDCVWVLWVGGRANVPHLMANPMPARVRTAVVIDGGNLKQPWVPECVTSIHGADYIRLSCGDRRLAQFVGLPCDVPHPFQSISWFNDLKHKRMEEMVRAVQGNAARGDPFATEAPQHKPRGRRSMQSIITKAAAEDVPDTVEVSLPRVAYEGTTVGPIAMRLVGGSCMRWDCCPIMELTSENLHYMRIAALASNCIRDCDDGGGGAKRVRRDASERITFRPLHAAWNYQRGTVYTTYRNVDGLVFSKSFPVAASADNDLYHNNQWEAARVAHQFFLNNNVEVQAAERDPAGGGEPVLAVAGPVAEPVPEAEPVLAFAEPVEHAGPIVDGGHGIDEIDGSDP